MVYPAGDLLEDDAVFDRAFRFTYPNGLRSAEDITIRTQNEGETGSLLMFRDSFGSSLAPLLAEGYREILLVDIRYISPAVLGEMVSFEGQDVLFLYSENVLNNSETLK